MLVGAIISKFVWVQLPSFATLSRELGRLLVLFTGVQYEPQMVGTMLLGAGLAFCWGVAYHVSRH
jgi:hypothetical protein